MSELTSASSSQLLPGYEAPGHSRESGGCEPIAATTLPAKVFLGQEFLWRVLFTVSLLLDGYNICQYIKDLRNSGIATY